MKSIQRIISFLLVMVMVIGIVPPMEVHAEETEVTETIAEVTKETTVPTEVVTEPTEETTVPTEVVTEPTEESTVSTEPVTEPTEGSSAPAEEPVAVTSIEIIAETDCIAPGETLQLIATVLPENATNQDVIWSSQDESVLTVDENGLVTGIAGGCTFVVATANDSSGVAAQYEVAVFDEAINSDEGTVWSSSEGSEYTNLKQMFHAVGRPGHYVFMSKKNLEQHAVMLMKVEEDYINVLEYGGGNRYEVRKSQYTYDYLMNYGKISICEANNYSDFTESKILQKLNEVYSIFEAWSEESYPIFTANKRACVHTAASPYACSNCNVENVVAALKNAGIIDFSYSGEAYTCVGFCHFATRYVYGKKIFGGNQSVLAFADTSKSISGNTGSAGTQLPTNVFSFQSGINGSTGSMSSLSVAPGEIFTMPQSGYSYTGFEVAGWNLKRSDGLWLTNSGNFASGEDATIFGYYTFHSGYQYTFKENWLNGEDCSFTFYPIWQESESDIETEEGLREELTNGKTKIKLEGSVTLDKDLVIPAGTTLTIASGKTLNVPKNVKLTNNGEIVIGEQYAESKSLLKICGTCENYGEITISDGGVENEGVLNNNGGLYVAGWGSVHVINSGTMVNNGRIYLAGAKDDVLDAQFINSGTYTQTESASFQQRNGYVTGVSPTNIDLDLYAQVTTADIQELIDANYRDVALYVQNDLTVTQDLTLPENFSFLFEGNTLTIPEGIRLTVDGAYPCELSRDSCGATVNVQGELYCNGDYGWVDMWDGTMNISGKLVVNNCLEQGKLIVLDGGTLINNGRIDNYGQPADLTLSEMAIFMNNGYIAGVNERDNSTDVSVTGTSYSYAGMKDISLSEATDILEYHGVTTDEVFVIWQAGLLRPEDGEEATITVNNYDGTWYLLGYGSHGNDWGLAGVCYEPTYDLWFGDRWLYDYAVVLVNDTTDIPSEDTEIWIEADMTLTDDMLVPEGSSVYIAEDVTVTVPAGVELNIQGYMEVYGNLIFEDGSTLTITDKYIRCLCIWTGKLDATGADISGVPYGTVQIQLNSTAEIKGIPNELLYASTYVYSSEDVNAALAQASNYTYLDLYVYTSFALTNNITIPNNTEIIIWQWDPEADAPSIEIPSGVAVTNNGWFTLKSGRVVIDQGAKLINNNYTTVREFASLLVLGEFLQNGTLDGEIYGSTMSQPDFESAMRDCAENGYGWIHENETVITSDMTIDLGDQEFRLSKYGRIIVSDGATLTINSAMDTGCWTYGDHEIGQIIVQSGGKLVINGDLQTHDTAKTELILEDGSSLKINGRIFANDSIEIGKGTVVEVNGYWIGYAPTNNDGTILPEAKNISVSVENTMIDVDKTEYVTLYVTVDSRSEQNLIPGVVNGATWTSSDHDIVDPTQIQDRSEGEYRAYLAGKTGTVTLTATSIDGSGKTATITLEVIRKGSNVKNRVIVSSVALEGQTSVWVDGAEYAIQTDGDSHYVDLPDGNAKTMISYTYHVGDSAEIHTQYPVSMKVWMLESVDGIYTVTRVDELDDILQYSGMSIRVTGRRGIRMITSIEKSKKSTLTSGGLSGYTLEEYGTVVAWASQLGENKPLVLGASYAKSNYAYKKGVANAVFADDGNLMQYTNVLVGFSNEQCKDDLAMRSYMILEDAEGNEITLYGGIVQRSIGYIALQNKDAFAKGTKAYEYVWDIIHSAYGNVYDKAYRG